MSDVAHIELPSSETRGHVCEVLLVTPDQAAMTYSIVIEQHLMHHVCNQAVIRVAVFTPTPESCSVVAHVMHVTDRRVKLLRRIWKDMCFVGQYEAAGRNTCQQQTLGNSPWLPP